MTQMQYRTCTYQPANNASQRVAGIAFIAALHSVFFYALLAGLHAVPMPAPRPPFNGYVIPDDAPVSPPPPPPEPTFSPPRPNDPIVPFIEFTEPSGPGAITVPPPIPETAPAKSATDQVATLESPPPLPLTLTPARAISATHTIPEYPPASRRLGEQGTLRLRVDITADGTVNAAQVETSSGHRRLDDAAVQWVKAHWRYEPAREGSKAVASTALAIVTFKLQ